MIHDIKPHFVPKKPKKASERPESFQKGKKTARTVYFFKQKSTFARLF